jgi:LysR family transcriptional regulator, nod-box dependent transcriptional activator
VRNRPGSDGHPPNTDSLPSSRLAGLDLNLLVALQALLHDRSVTRAGDRLGLSQPAMSATLRRLRQMFDDKLLVRVGRNLQLTAFARELIEPVDRVLLETERVFTRRARFDPATSTRAFSVELSDYAMFLLLDPLVQRLLAEAPGITVHCHPLEPPVGERVKTGVVDLLVTTAQPIEGLYSRVLFSDRWMCAVSADNRAVEDRLTPEVFQELVHMGIGFGFGTPPRPSDPELAYRRKGLHPRVPVTTESFVLAPFTVGRTGLATLVPERLGRRFESTAHIRLLELPFDLPDLTENMFWGPAAEADLAHAWLRNTLADVCRYL